MKLSIEATSVKCIHVFLLFFFFASYQSRIVLSFTIKTMISKPLPCVKAVTSHATKYYNTGKTVLSNPTFSNQQQRDSSFRAISLCLSSKTTEERNENNIKEQEQGGEAGRISDLDARILQSLLDDKDLDLKSETSLKKMLENKEKSDEDRNNPSKKTASGGDSAFSSTFFKTVTDNSIWNSFRAKTESVLESTKIFVQNRIERDATLLASLSLFAWERAIKDVGRALPSAGSTGAKVAETIQKTIFSLASNSSYVENNDEKGGGSFLLSSMSQYKADEFNGGSEKTIYDEFTTPRDEFAKVSDSIKDILAGKTISSSSDRGLRSIAPAGIARNAERQRLAFARKKETVLQREKEGLNKKALRAASSVTDAAWEIKREMQIEGNQAGYRSEDARNRLKASITSSALLEGGRNWVSRQLQGGKKDKSLKLESSNSFVQENKERDIDSKTEPIPDALIVDPEIIVQETSSARETKVDGQNFVDDIAEDTSDIELNKERERLISVLNLCLEAPEETWLRFDLLAKASSKSYFFSNNEESNDEMLNNEDAWENVINLMVSAKNDLEVASSITREYSKDEVIAEMYNMKSTVDTITTYVADVAGNESAMFLKELFLGEVSIPIQEQQRNTVEMDTTMSLPQIVVNVSVDSNEETINEVFSTVESTTQEYEEASFKTQEFDGEYQTVVADVLPSEEYISSDSIATQNINKMMTDVEFEISIKDVDDKFMIDEPTNDVEVISSDKIEVVAAEVDVITTNDDDFIDGATRIHSANVEDDTFTTEKESRQENVFINLALRTIDVFFFVAEKTITVGIPGIFDLVQSINEKTTIINRNGLGSEGWERLGTVNDARNRY